MVCCMESCMWSNQIIIIILAQNYHIFVEFICYGKSCKTILQKCLPLCSMENYHFEVWKQHEGKKIMTEIFYFWWTELLLCGKRCITILQNVLVLCFMDKNNHFEVWKHEGGKIMTELSFWGKSFSLKRLLRGKESAWACCRGFSRIACTEMQEDKVRASPAFRKKRRRARNDYARISPR